MYYHHFVNNKVHFGLDLDHWIDFTDLQARSLWPIRKVDFPVSGCQMMPYNVTHAALIAIIYFHYYYGDGMEVINNSNKTKTWNTFSFTSSTDLNKLLRNKWFKKVQLTFHLFSSSHNGVMWCGVFSKSSFGIVVSWARTWQC